METSLLFARAILNGFESYFAEFQNITLAARPRFENADWPAVHTASRERIDLYKRKINRAVETLRGLAGVGGMDTSPHELIEVPLHGLGESRLGFGLGVG